MTTNSLERARKDLDLALSVHALLGLPFELFGFSVCPGYVESRDPGCSVILVSRGAHRRRLEGVGWTIGSSSLSEPGVVVASLSFFERLADECGLGVDAMLADHGGTRYRVAPRSVVGSDPDDVRGFLERLLEHLLADGPVVDEFASRCECACGCRYVVRGSSAGLGVCSWCVRDDHMVRP